MPLRSFQMKVDFDLTKSSEMVMLRDLEKRGLAKVGQPMEPPGHGSICVYLFAAHHTGPVKIGISDNVERRLRTLTNASGRRLRCFGATAVPSREIAQKLERGVHQRFILKR